ncbi:MAG: extracellular solute-binding protein [Treponema sp.]|jgi:putative aldouronate transport system substrate-binding protein|nr:extracellular solute-binding protein [Treponema sp.]
MKNNFPVLLLAAVLISAAGISGCSNKTDGGTRSPDADSAAPAKMEVSYPITASGEKKLSFWIPIAPVATKHISSYNENIAYQEISKNTGVEVDFIHPVTGQEREQLGVLIASGDLPDIIEIRGLYTGGSSAGVADGLFLDMTEMIPVHAPDYYREITRSDLSYRIATNNDNSITDFLLIKQRAPVFRRANYRQDVMDKLGLDVPITVADYEDDFAKMKAAGLTGFAPQADGRIDLFMWPYGIAPGFYLGSDGKVKFGEAEPAYKQYLELMNGWYNKGYISKDFTSNMLMPQRQALFTTNQVSMIINPVDLVLSACNPSGIIPVPLPYPRLHEGQPIHFQPVSFETLPLRAEPFNTVVTSSCKSPEVAVEYLNYFYTREGADICNWGIKDLTYTVDPGGKKTFTDYMLRNEKIPLADVQFVLKMHQCAKLSEPDVLCNPNVVYDSFALEIRNRYSDDATIDDFQVLPPFQLGLEDSQARAAIMRDINTYINEMTLKFITNVTPLSEFENYLAQIKAMNIDEAIDITAKGYEQFMTKPGIR